MDIQRPNVKHEGTLVSCATGYSDDGVETSIRYASATSWTTLRPLVTHLPFSWRAFNLQILGPRSKTCASLPCGFTGMSTSFPHTSLSHLSHPLSQSTAQTSVLTRHHLNLIRSTARIPWSGFKTTFQQCSRLLSPSTYVSRWKSLSEYPRTKIVPTAPEVITWCCAHTIWIITDVF